MTSIRKLARRLSRALYACRHGYQHTGERVNPDFADENFRNHLRFYQFASQFVRGKEVLDCGCGTGYGSAMNRSGFVGGSNFQIGWSRYEQDDEQVFP
ncbi:MAG: hypothetical protein ING09_13295 [Roseomonas sp.]|nr:hypothetical protein [Roseomonas sp.]MCA3291142.1 hypothetical protein [Roseomonas sp.]MCA3294454.1 hypothetical protein [Roseomonas sp.]